MKSKLFLASLLICACSEEERLTPIRFTPPPPAEEKACSGAENNGVWEPQTVPVEQGLGAIWGLGPRQIWAAGGSGTILFYDGNSWIDQTPPDTTAGDLLAIHGTGANDVWIAGRFGVVQHFDGQTWSVVSNDSMADVFAIWAFGEDDVWLATSEGPRNWNGRNFSKSASWPSKPVHGIWAASERDLWMVGDGSLFHFDGASFEEIEIEEAGLLAAIWGAGGSLWTIGHSSGGRPGFGERKNAEWSFAAAPPRAVFFTVWSLDGSNIWVGASDTSIFLRSGGSWCREHLEGVGATNAFYGSSSGDIWAAGARRGAENQKLPLLLRRRP